MIDIEKAKLDPSQYFASPRDVVDCNMPKHDKLTILKRWEYEIRAMEVAEEENMAGPDSITLADVIEAIHLLKNDKGGNDDTDSAPTKQGGK